MSNIDIEIIVHQVDEAEMPVDQQRAREWLRQKLIEGRNEQNESN